MNDAVQQDQHVRVTGPNEVIGPDGRRYVFVGQGYLAAADASFDLPPEAAALLASFPARLTDAERRIDRVLARLGIE